MIRKIVVKQDRIVNTRHLKNFKLIHLALPSIPTLDNKFVWIYTSNLWLSASLGINRVREVVCILLSLNDRVDSLKLLWRRVHELLEIVLVTSKLKACHRCVLACENGSL